MPSTVTNLNSVLSAKSRILNLGKLSEIRERTSVLSKRSNIELNVGREIDLLRFKTHCVRIRLIRRMTFTAQHTLKRKVFFF